MAAPPSRIPRRPPMPRVLLVSQPTDGGVFRHVSDLAEGLPGHGFEVVLAAPPLQTPPPTDLTVELPLVRSPSPREDTRAVAALARAVRELRPALVHAHSSKAGAVARIARALAPRTPVLYTPHGYAHAGYFESARPAPCLRGGRARAHAARVAHRVRVRGGAPTRPRARSGRPGPAWCTTASTARRTPRCTRRWRRCARRAIRSSPPSRCCARGRGSRPSWTRSRRCSPRSPPHAW